MIQTTVLVSLLSIKDLLSSGKLFSFPHVFLATPTGLPKSRVIYAIAVLVPTVCGTGNDPTFVPRLYDKKNLRALCARCMALPVHFCLLRPCNVIPDKAVLRVIQEEEVLCGVSRRLCICTLWSTLLLLSTTQIYSKASSCSSY